MLQVLGPVPEVEDMINDPSFDITEYYGYIYMTVHIKTGRSYIGKKAFQHITNKKLGKKELDELPVARGKKPTKKLSIVTGKQIGRAHV